MKLETKDMKEPYLSFLHEASRFIPQDRIYTDELRRLAWGTDAGFYLSLIYISEPSRPY